MKFKQIRITALDHWLTESQRLRDINDDYSMSIECTWQEELVPEDDHNSLFCSLAEWSTNISDLLSEKTYDNLKFDNQDHQEKLFRHYTRILLIVSEILTDFKDVLKYIKEYSGNRDRKNRKATKQLSNPNLEFSCSELFEYINNVCKHKIGDRGISRKIKYHVCNHHIKYSFKDDPNFIRIKNSLKVKNIKTKILKKNMKLEVPELMEILDQVLCGYIIIDKALNQKGKKKFIRNKLKIYETELEED